MDHIEKHILGSAQSAERQGQRALNEESDE